MSDQISSAAAESENRYRAIFENSPVSIWEEDFSAVKILFDRLRQEGVSDLDAYFEQYPDVLRECAEQVKIIDINQATLTLHGAKSKQELLAGLVNTFTPESFVAFRKEIVGLWHGINSMSLDAVVKTLDGELRHVTVNFTVCPGCEETLSRIFVSLTDITERKRFEQTLSESELRQTRFIANLPAFFFTFRFCENGKLCFPYASPGIRTLYGLEPEDVREDMTPLHMLAHPDDRPYIEASLEEAFKTLEPFRIEFRVCRPDMPERWLECRSVAVPDSEGNPLWHGIMLDITDRKAAELKLNQAVGFTEGVINAIPDILFEVDVEGRYLNVWTKRPELLAAPKEALIGKTVNEILPPDTAAAAMAAIHEADVEGISLGNILRLDLPDETRWFEHTVSKLPSDDPTSGPSFIVLSRDVTDRKRAEEALRSQRDQLSNIYATSPVGITMVDRNGQIIDANPQAEKVLGLEKEAILQLQYNTPAWKITGLDGSPFPEDQLPFTRVKATGQPVKDIQHAIQWPDGRRVFLSINAAPLFDEAGQFDGMISSLEDITERKEAEKKLLEREQLFRALVENSPDFVARYDLEYRRVYVNPAIQKLFSIPPEDVIGETPKEHSPMKTPQVYIDHLQQVIDTGSESFLEAPFRTAQGEMHWGQIRFTPEFDENNRIVSVLAIGRDINELKVNEKLLLEAQQIAHIGNWWHDMVTGEIYWSDEFFSIIGREPQTPGYELIQEVVHPDDLPLLLKEMQESASSEVEHDHNFRIIRPDGEIRWIRNRWRRVNDADGNEIRHVGTHQDITEQKLMEEKLRASEQQFRSLAENSPDNVVRYDRDRRLVYYNPAMAQTLPHDAEKLLGKTPIEAGFGGPEISAEYEGHIQRVLESGESSDLEMVVPNPDGRLHTHLVRFTAERDSNGSIASVLAIGRDITELKLIDDTLFFLAQHGWQTDSENFFDALVQFLGKKFDVDYVIVDKLGESTDVAETVALYAKGAIAPNIHYALKDTPCENVMGHKLCLYPREVQRHFPNDPLLADMGVESYLGIPLWDSFEQPVGLIAILDSKPLAEDTPAIQILQLVATRAAAELQREQSERELRASEQRFQAIFNNSFQLIGLLSTDGTLLEANQASMELVHVDKDEVVGKPFWEAPWWNHSPELQQRLRDAIHKAANGEFVRFEAEHPDQDGNIHYVDFSLKPITDADGRVIQLIPEGRDITDRKQADDALRTSEHRYRIAQAMGHVGNWEYNLQTTHFWGSDEAKRIYGFDPAKDDFSTDEVERCIPERERVHQALIDLIEKEKSYNLEFEIQPRDGSAPRIITSVAELQRDEHGNPLRVTGVIQDVTQLKQAERERQLYAEFLANMDRINRAIQGADDLDSMLRDVLDEVLDIFDCDRAVLVYPCDPAANSWTSPMEQARPEYPGLGTMDLDIPMDQEVAAMFKLLLETRGVVKFGAGTEHPLPDAGENIYGIKSFMAVALFPKTGKPWQFGIHQCSHARAWTEAEEQLLEEIGRRLSDGLSSLLTLRDLRESEARYQRLFDTANEGIWIQDENFVTTFVNEHMANMLGYSADELQGMKVTDFMTEEDAVDHVHKMDERSKNISDIYERRMRHKDGSDVWLLISATPVFEKDRFHGSFAMLTDITARKKAELLLASNEQLFRTMVEHSPDYIARYDHDLRRIYINPALDELFTTQKSEIIGKLPEDSSPLIEPELYMSYIRQAIESASEYSTELSYQQPDGCIRWSNSRFIPEFGPDGEVATVMVISTDITERKQAEEERQLRAELLANMDRINRAIQGTNDLETMMRNVLDEVLDIFACDRAFLVYPCDPGAKSWTVPMERTRPEYPGAGILNEEIPMDEEVATTLELLLNSPGIVKFGPETDHPLPKDVSERYGFKSFMSMAIYPKVGKAWQFGIHQCSYERVWTAIEEEQLEEIGRRLTEGLTSLLILRDMRESERKLVEAQRLAHTGNWELDLIDNTLTWSDEIYRIFEIDKDKFGASYEAFLDAIHPDDREMVNTAYTDSLENKQPYNIVHRLLMKNGRVKYVNERCETFYDAVGKPVRSVGTVQDITEQKLKEDELRRYRDHLEETVQQRTEALRLARDAAEAANKAKSVFLANMSHELRTPLNAILGFSQMMQQDSHLNANQHETLDIINNSGEHLLKLINDVLEIAKIEAGKLQLDIATFDLQGLVREVSDMMRLRAKQKGLQLELDQSSEFPRYIKGDEARLRQILVNLVSNAVKFTVEGMVKIRLSIKNNARHHLVIEIKDTGPGISKEDLQRLFKPFVQLPEGKTHIGSGLGLSIVHQFVQLMKGTISVESTPGKGSLFRVELPLNEADDTDIDRLSGEHHGEVVGLEPGQPTYRILIAEDHRDNQLLLANLMTDIGMEVKTADNGEECVEIFKDWKPDLIWMDHRMPVMDGGEATRRIRKMRNGKKVKIVAVTASAFKEQQSELLDAGMDGFVSKPYKFSEIYDTMAQQLGVRFTYSEKAPVKPLPSAVTQTQLEAIPMTILTELQDAAESLDRERIHATINHITELDKELGHALSRMADEFDYPSILDLLKSVAARNHNT